MSNTLKRAAELLRGSGKRLAALTSVPAIMAHKTELDSIAAELDLMAQVEPVAWVYDTYVWVGSLGSYVWRETFERDRPNIGKNVRNITPLYAAPQEPVNQQMLAALQKIAGMTMSMYSTQIEAILDAKRVANAAIAAAEDVQAQKGGAL